MQSIRDYKKIRSLAELKSYLAKPVTEEESTGFSLSDTISELGKGFVEGVTTFPLLGESKANNTIERIANSIGHLMGFAGFIPNPASITAKLAGRLIDKAVFKDLAKMPISIGFKSLPMLVADKAMDKLGGLGLKSALEASNYYKAGNVLEGALHLGIASAVSSKPITNITEWQERIDGFMSGAMFGGVNRMIGNVFSRGGIVDFGGKYFNKTTDELISLAQKDATLAKDLTKKIDAVNGVARAISSSLMSITTKQTMSWPIQSLKKAAQPLL